MTRCTVRNLALCVCLLFAHHLAQKHLVYASGNCSNQRSQCTGTAAANYNNCIGQCAIGNTACTNSCSATQTSAKTDCGNQYQTCITYEGNDCTSGVGYSCPGSGNYPLCSFTSPSETCYCYCLCNSSPPSCPGGPNAAGCTGSGWVCNSPILIDTSGKGIDLTSPEAGVDFDLWGNGVYEHWSWTRPESGVAWLALDRNNNGLVDNGTELFGSATPQPKPPVGDVPNGFNALAAFDSKDNGGNEDGAIDEHDSIYNKLWVWFDENHDGISQPNELRTLAQAGIAKIDLGYRESKREDEYGNYFRYKGRIWDAAGDHSGKYAWDVFLARVKSGR